VVYQDTVHGGAFPIAQNALCHRIRRKREFWMVNQGVFDICGAVESFLSRGCLIRPADRIPARRHRDPETLQFVFRTELRFPVRNRSLKVPVGTFSEVLSRSCDAHEAFEAGVVRRELRIGDRPTELLAESFRILKVTLAPARTMHSPVAHLSADAVHANPV